jgi:hypothetical protein
MHFEKDGGPYSLSKASREIGDVEKDAAGLPFT